MSFKSESGRSMLEMVLVVGLIILLTMGALEGYQQVIASHSATSIHEDIMVQAQFLKGHNYNGKSTYDSGIGKKTRTGLEMTSPSPDSDSDTFSIIVQGISSKTCSYFNQLDWLDALRLKVNEDAFPANKINCNPLKESREETFDLEVLFSRKAEAVASFERTCENCMSCEKCNNSTNSCVNNCPDSEHTCVNNKCINKITCAKGKTVKNNACETCETNYSETCSSCAEKSSTKPYWSSSEKCVCYGSSCGSGYYCKDGECVACGIPEKSCLFSADEVNSTTQCTTKQKITCTGTTPHCHATSGQCIQCNTPEQKCNITNNTVDTTSGCITVEKITCSSSDNPACFTDGKCHACPSNATCSNGTITCNSGYTLDNDQCVKTNLFQCGNSFCTNTQFCNGTYVDNEYVESCSDCPDGGSHPATDGYVCCKNGNSLNDSGKYEGTDSACCPSGYETFSYTESVGTGCCVAKEISFCPNKIDNVQLFKSNLDDGCSAISCCTNLSNNTNASMENTSFDGNTLTYNGNLITSQVYETDLSSCNLTVNGQFEINGKFKVQNLTCGNENVDYGLLMDGAYVDVTGNINATGKKIGMVIGNTIHSSGHFIVSGNVTAIGNEEAGYQQGSVPGKLSINGVLTAQGGLYGLKSNSHGSGLINSIIASGTNYGAYITSGIKANKLTGTATSNSFNGAGVYISGYSKVPEIIGKSFGGTGVYASGNNKSSPNITGYGKENGVIIDGSGSESYSSIKGEGIDSAEAEGYGVQFYSIEFAYATGKGKDFGVRCSDSTGISVTGTSNEGRSISIASSTIDSLKGIGKPMDLSNNNVYEAQYCSTISNCVNACTLTDQYVCTTSGDEFHPTTIKNK